VICDQVQETVVHFRKNVHKKPISGGLVVRDLPFLTFILILSRMWKGFLHAVVGFCVGVIMSLSDFALVGLKNVCV